MRILSISSDLGQMPVNSDGDLLVGRTNKRALQAASRKTSRTSLSQPTRFLRKVGLVAGRFGAKVYGHDFGADWCGRRLLSSSRLTGLWTAIPEAAHWAGLGAFRCGRACSWSMRSRLRIPRAATRRSATLNDTLASNTDQPPPTKTRFQASRKTAPPPRSGRPTKIVFANALTD